MSHTSLPPPADADAFCTALGEGRLLLKSCLGCGQPHFYPRPHCPFCGHHRTDWMPASGRGTIYSLTVARGTPRPMAVAIVELAEGPRLTSTVIDSDLQALRIGDEVVLSTVPGDAGHASLAFTTPQARRARAYVARAVAAAGTLPDAPADTPELRHTAVVGAGNMGAGIATALLGAGLSVCLIDHADAALESARRTIDRHLDLQVQRGRASEADVARRRSALRTSTAVADVAGADLVIEAVWEQMAVKQEIFAQIDRHADAHAVLGTNTSTLDIDRIADATQRPGQVVGLHFFSPAHVMPLLEVVRGPRTEPAVIAAALRLGALLGKTAVVVGICDGFVGNRLMIVRDREADRLLLEGALPQQIDRVLTEFGLPMGTYELADMAGGIALAYRARQDQGVHEPINARLVAAGRLGQKCGKGYYRYETGKRRPLVDPDVAALIEAASAQAGVERRPIGDGEIRDRLILPMINEGAKLLEEGIVSRASDIDVIWQRGFGWPAWRGGPMYHADRLGADRVVARLLELQEHHGERFRPATLLQRMVQDGTRFIPEAD